MDTDRFVNHFDPFDPELMEDPVDGWRALRDEKPVAWSDQHGGFWVISRYEDVHEAAQDYESFSSANDLGRFTGVGTGRIVPLESDPPEHTQLRRLVLDRLSPQAIGEIEPRVLAVTTKLIDAFIEDGEADLCEMLAIPMPAMLIAELVGIPLEDSMQFRQWMHTSVKRRIEDPDGAKAAYVALQGYLSDLLRSRQTEHHHDIIGCLQEARIDGQPLPEPMLRNYIYILLAGGLETTTSAIGGTLLYLDEHPDERRVLQDYGQLPPEAVEEFLRYTSPLTMRPRTVMREVAVAGTVLKPGDRAMLLWGSANRDEAEFQQPDRCVLSRARNRHLAFGAGVHRCIGSNLARVEFRIAVEQVLTRLPDYCVDRDRVRWVVGGGRGVVQLPVTFSPGLPSAHD
jgi:cytochrome P450